MRPVYLYRIEATFPEEPNWETWESDNPGLDRDVFRWPRRRNYLSGEVACRMARLMEGWGATCVVLKSEPVAFPGLNDVAEVRRARLEADNDRVIAGLRQLVATLENED